MCPPTGFVGSPNIACGLEWTWFVTTVAALVPSINLSRSRMCARSFCCLSAKVPLPKNSALKAEVSESIPKSLTGYFSANSRALSTINICWSELYALPTCILLRTSTGSKPYPSAIDLILSGLNVFSVSMSTPWPFNPPSSIGSCTVTNNWCIIWVLPEPNSP